MLLFLFFYCLVCYQTYTKASDTISVDAQWEECRYLIQQPAGRIIILDLELSGYSYHGARISVRLYLFFIYFHGVMLLNRYGMVTVKIQHFSASTPQ